MITYIPAPKQGAVIGAVASAGLPKIPQSTPVPKPQYTDSQLSAQSWINNSASGQGGMDAYTANQNKRWEEANASGDKDLINRLQTDSQRVGYNLTPIPKAATVPAPQTMVSSSSTVPVPANTINTTSLQADAAARLAKQRAGVKQAVDYTLAGLKNNYDYTRQITNDNRVMENQDFKRNNNPFSGKTDYLTSQLLRNRSIQDTAMNRDYQSNAAAAQQKLADFDSMAPEQQQSIYDDLVRIERDYGLNVGQLTGNFNGQRTLAGSAQDANFTGMYNGQQTLQSQNQNFQQQMALADLTGQYNGQSTLAGKQANLNAALQVGNQLGQVVAPTQTWGDLFTQNGSPNYQAQQDSIKNSQWKQTFEENVRQYGLDYALQRMQAESSMANSAADNARQNQALQLNREEFNWSKDQKNPDNVYKNAQVGNLNADNLRAETKNKIDNLMKIHTSKDPISGETVITNPDKLRNAVIASGQSEEEIDQMLAAFGLLN